MTAVTIACNRPSDPRRSGYRVTSGNTAANFDKVTGRLERLEIDQNRDGKMDTWSYMDGARVKRIEIDRDGDGVVDRWEHYAESKLTKVGSSSRNDGVEDTWSFQGIDGFLARVEADGDRDGKVDKWEHFSRFNDKPVLSVVELDTRGQGHPTRRLHYRTDGRFERVEFLNGTSGLR